MRADMAREYESTHSWLIFKVGLRAAPAALWIAAGEAQSKCQHIAGSPLHPEIADALHTVYLAKGIRGTAAIEGNTLTEREVRDQIRGRLRLPPSQQYLAQEVENIIDAANGLLDEIERVGSTPLTVGTLRSFNRSVLHNLELDPDIVPGVTRNHSVGVLGYRAAPYQDCDYLMRRLCDWLNGPDFQPEPGLEIVSGILKSIVAHIYFVWIHPFDDGNGRTARLIEVKFLLEAGVPSAAAHLLSNHYNLTRTNYYRQLDRTSKSGGDILSFLEYAVHGYVDQLREHIYAIRFQQWHTAWINYVHDIMGPPKSPAERRQLKLILAISKRDEPVTRREMPRLTPDLAEEYATKTTKTITRDLNALRKHGLVVREDGGYRPSMDKILAFLPRTKKGIAAESPTVNDEARQLLLL